MTQVFARSPEAKDRIERANGTFQDRLVAELRLAGVSTVAEANRFLESFLPRFNERFGVPPAQPEPAYRRVDPETEIEGVLCFKERRRVARDNTVQYHGKTLQVFPGMDRRSYARLHVEVQQRLDGRLMVYYRGKTLTPLEAPPLADSLSAMAIAMPRMQGYLSAPEPESQASDAAEHETVLRKIWYEDSEMKRIHTDLIKAGMERARQRGKRIGRPRVSERPDFTQRFAAMAERLGLGLVSRRQAAKQLSIGYATIKRLLDAQLQSTAPITDSHCIALAEVLD